MSYSSNIHVHACHSLATMKIYTYRLKVLCLRTIKTFGNYKGVILKQYTCTRVSFSGYCVNSYVYRTELAASNFYKSNIHVNYGGASIMKQVFDTKNCIAYDLSSCNIKTARVKALLSNTCRVSLTRFFKLYYQGVIYYLLHL